MYLDGHLALADVVTVGVSNESGWPGLTERTAGHVREIMGRTEAVVGFEPWSRLIAGLVLVGRLAENIVGLVECVEDIAAMPARLGVIEEQPQAWTARMN